MNRHRIGRVVPAVLALVLFILVSSGVALSAAPGNPFDVVLAKLDQILAALNPPLPPGTVTLASAPVALNVTTQLYCLIANVGTETVEGSMRLVISDGTVIDNAPFSVQPGRHTGILGVGPAVMRCEFTFEGSATSVRALMEVVSAAGEPLAIANIQ